MPLPSLNDIDTLLLDMDGTLLDLRFDNHFWVEHLPIRYSDIHDLAFEHANEHVETSLSAVEGTMDWYCVHHWSDHFDVDIMHLKNEVAHLVQYREGSLEFLEALKHVPDLKVYLVTDAHPKVLQLKQSITGVLDHVDHWYCSHDFGYPKRHPDFWRLLAEEIEYPAPSTLMIDDSPHVLAQSRSAGIGHQLCIEKPDSGRTHDHAHDFLLIDDLSSLTAPFSQPSASPLMDTADQ